jgi:membrane protein implicated in regulation of membrane protease activity
MKPLKPFVFLSLIALTLASASAQQKRNGEMTLAQAREALVGKKVVVIGHTSQDYLLKDTY